MLVMSEITPVKARGAASAITVVVAWLSSFVVTKVKFICVITDHVSSTMHGNVFTGVCPRGGGGGGVGYVLSWSCPGVGEVVCRILALPTGGGTLTR